jgi:hypothetical protein
MSKDYGPNVEKAVQSWGEITIELRKLEGKTDPQSLERYDEFVEQLMCADMALSPVKEAMKKAAEEKETSNPRP